MMIGTDVNREERWSRLQMGLNQLHARIESMDTTQRCMERQFAMTSKSLNQAARGQAVMTKQLKTIEQAVAKLGFSPRSIARDGFSPALDSWDEAVEPPASSPIFGLGTSSMLFPSVREVPTHCAMYQQRNVQGVFNEVHHKEVVWDDELIDNSDLHDGLLQQLAQGGEYLDAGFAQHELHTVEEAMCVEHAVPVHHPASMTSLLFVEAVCSVFDERPQVDVLWDEEMQYDTSMHDGILQLLASGGEYLDLEKPEQVVFDLLHQSGKNLIGKEMKPAAEFSHNSGVFLSVELHNESVLLDRKYHKDTICDEKCPHGIGSHGGLLQRVRDGGQFLHEVDEQLERDEVLAYEEILIPAMESSLHDRQHESEPIVETIVGHSLGAADSDQAVGGLHNKGAEAKMLQELMAPSVVFSSTVVLSLYFQLKCSAGMRHHELKHRLVASIRRQWDPGIIVLHIMQLQIMQEIDGEGKCCTELSMDKMLRGCVQGVPGYDDSLGTSCVLRER